VSLVLDSMMKMFPGWSQTILPRNKDGRVTYTGKHDDMTVQVTVPCEGFPDYNVTLTAPDSTFPNQRAHRFRGTGRDLIALLRSVQAQIDPDEAPVNVPPDVPVIYKGVMNVDADKVIAALCKRPSLLFAVKEAIANTRVAGPWCQDDNGRQLRKSPTMEARGSEKRRHSNVATVTEALPRLRPSSPPPKPWEWIINDYHVSADCRKHGYCNTQEEGMAIVDQTLREVGWLLCDSEGDSDE